MDNIEPWLKIKKIYPSYSKLFESVVPKNALICMVLHAIAKSLLLLLLKFNFVVFFGVD